MEEQPRRNIFGSSIEFILSLNGGTTEEDSYSFICSVHQNKLYRLRVRHVSSVHQNKLCRLRVRHVVGRKETT